MSGIFLFKKSTRTIKTVQGFSLIEVMVAMSLFSFSMLGMVSMQINMNRMIQDAFQKNRALSLAISRHEILELARKNAESENYLLPLWEKELSEKIPYVSSHIDQETTSHVSILWVSSQQTVNNCEEIVAPINEEAPENCLRL